MTENYKVPTVYHVFGILACVITVAFIILIVVMALGTQDVHTFDVIDKTANCDIYCQSDIQ